MAGQARRDPAIHAGTMRPRRRCRNPARPRKAPFCQAGARPEGSGLDPRVSLRLPEGDEADGAAPRSPRGWQGGAAAPPPVMRRTLRTAAAPSSWSGKRSATRPSIPDRFGRAAAVPFLRRWRVARRFWHGPPGLAALARGWRSGWDSATPRTTQEQVRRCNVC